MLNSNKGGHIHIGISSTGQIEGVRINFDQRDGFRCGNSITDYPSSCIFFKYNFGLLIQVSTICFIIKSLHWFLRVWLMFSSFQLKMSLNYWILLIIGSSLFVLLFLLIPTRSTTWKTTLAICMVHREIRNLISGKSAVLLLPLLNSAYFLNASKIKQFSNFNLNKET